MHAMILGAGFGERLGSLGEDLPKPLLPVAGRPVVRYVVDWLRDTGLVDQLVVNAHHHADLVEREFAGDAGVTVLKEERILGTGGGIRNALSRLGRGTFAVVNGKILFAPDFATLLAAHRRSGAEATLVVRRVADAARYGAVHVDPAQGRVLAIGRVAGEPPPGAESDLMFTGVHFLEPGIADLLPAEGDVVRETYRAMLARGRPIHAVESAAPWEEVSTPAEYLRANLSRAGDGVLYVDRATVDIGAGAVLAGPSVIGRGVVVAPGVRVSRAVVWDGARVDRDVDSAVVTPRRVVAVVLPNSG